QAEPHGALVLIAPDRGRLHPGRPVLGTVLLVEVRPLDAIRIPLERERPIAQMGQQRRCDAQVVVEHLPLGESRRRIEDLVEVAELDALACDDDLLRGHPLFLLREACAALAAARRRGSARCRTSPASRSSPRFAAARLFCRASMRSTTLPRGSSAGPSATISSPSALRSSSASSCFR